jgi:hypothetical protein
MNLAFKDTEFNAKLGLSVSSTLPWKQCLFSHLKTYLAIIFKVNYILCTSRSWQTSTLNKEEIPLHFCVCSVCYKTSQLLYLLTYDKMEVINLK